jgi:hypothetical protein
MSALRSLEETERDPEVAGEDGGGMATALGIRARGVFRDGRPLEGVGDGPPERKPDTEDRGPGFGVMKEDGGSPCSTDVPD